MSISLISKIKPQNGGAFPVYEDVDVQGGFQIRTNPADRDSIPALNRKIGMLVFSQSDTTYYTLVGGILNANWAIADLGGGTDNLIAQNIPVTAGGQVVFTLSQPPAQPTAVSMFINGLRQTYGTNYTVSGSVATYIPGMSLITSDVVDFLYVGGGGLAGTLGMDVQQNGTSIDPNANHINFTGNVSVTENFSGSVSVAVGNPPDSKIRAYTSVNEAGNAVSVVKIAVWDTVSSLISVLNASLISGNTQLTTTQTGRFTIAGQLSIQPTAGSIDGVLVEIVRNGTVIHSISDYGAIWLVGITNSIGFNFNIELSASDDLSVQWTHFGSVGSTTQIMGGDKLSWFAIDKINSVTASAGGSAPNFIVTGVKTAVYSANTNELVQCDPTAGGFTINIPTAGGRTGQHIVVKNVSISTNSITLLTTGIETIDGSFTQIINIAYQSLELVSTGIEWIIV